MQQLEKEKTKQPEPNLEKPKAKPAPIENWENEGGNVIPTGSLPKIPFPKKEEQEPSEKSAAK